MRSEWLEFQLMLRRLGIHYKVNWQARKDIWEAPLKDGGFKLPIGVCSVIAVGTTEYLFVNGIVDRHGNCEGQGPSAVCLMSRDSITGQVEHRLFYDREISSFRLDMHGLEALRKQYAEAFAPQKAAAE